jgi:hypothetical protein
MSRDLIGIQFSNTIQTAIIVIVFLGISFAVWKGLKSRRAKASGEVAIRQDDVPVIQRVPSESERTATAAREHETARDFESAARLYQQAGLHEEAGRVRREHIEPVKRSESTVVHIEPAQRIESTVVNIDRVGDTILHDSVMIDSEGEDVD